MKAILSIIFSGIKSICGVRCHSNSCIHLCPAPLDSWYQDMEVKKGEFQIIGRVVKKEKRY